MVAAAKVDGVVDKRPPCCDPRSPERRFHRVFPTADRGRCSADVRETRSCKPTAAEYVRRSVCTRRGDTQSDGRRPPRALRRSPSATAQTGRSRRRSQSRRPAQMSQTGFQNLDRRTAEFPEHPSLHLPEWRQCAVQALHCRAADSERCFVDRMCPLRRARTWPLLPSAIPWQTRRMAPWRLSKGLSSVANPHSHPAPAPEQRATLFVQRRPHRVSPKRGRIDRYVPLLPTSCLLEGLPAEMTADSSAHSRVFVRQAL